MKFHFLPYHIVKDKIRSIIEENKEDFKRFYGDIEPDYDHFETLSLLGMGYISLIVDKDVIGFAAFIINENANHEGKEAENVVFFIKKEHRGKYFTELVKYSKSELLKLGVPKITMTVKNTDLVKLMKRYGFKKEYEILEVSCE